MSFWAKQFQDVLVCTIGGAFAASLVILNVHSATVLPELPGALCMFLLAMLYRPIPLSSAVIGFLFLGIALCPNALAFSIFRVSLTTIGISLLRRRIIPAAVITTAWVIAIFLLMTFRSSSVVGALGPRLVASALLEITVSVFLWMMLCTRLIIDWWNIEHVSLRHFMVHLFLMPLVAVFLLIFLYPSRYFGTGLLHHSGLASLNEISSIFAVFVLVSAAILCAVMAAHYVIDFIGRFERASFDPDAPVGWSAFSDVQDLLQRMREQGKEWQVFREAFTQTLEASGLGLQDLPTVWAGLRQSLHVLGGMPDAAFALTEEGRIVVATPALNSILGIQKGSLIDSDQKVIGGGGSPWARDVAKTIEWSMAHRKELLNGGPRRFVSEAFLNKRLETFVRAWPPKKSAKSGSAEMAWAFYVRVVPDEKPLHDVLCLPTAFEKLGAAMTDFFVSLAENVDHAAEHVSLLTTKFTHGVDSSGRPLPGSEDGEEILQLLLECDRVLRRLTGIVEEQSKRVTALDDGQEGVRIADFIASILTYVENNQLSASPIPFTVTGPVEGPLETNTIANEEVDPAARDAFCRLPAGETAGFGQYLVWFLRCILPKAPDLKARLDQEQLGTSTASLITGAVPGRYVRIGFEHSGQSIPTQVISSPHETNALFPASKPDPVQLALFLLTRQIKRLGGFIIVQSSPVKGTNVSIYLPTDSRTSQRLRMRDIRRLTGTYHRAHSKSAAQVLVVGEKTEEIERVEAILKRCVCAPVLRTPKELFGEFGTPVAFQGRGFAESEGSGEHAIVGAGTSPEKRLNLDITPVRLLVFDASAASYAALSLLDELESEIPKIPKLVLLAKADTRMPVLPPNWTVVNKPFTDEDLEEQIKSALSDGGHIQESLFMLEGNDPFSGSGLD